MQNNRSNEPERTTTGQKLLGVAILLGGTLVFLALAFVLGRPILEMSRNPDALEEFLEAQGALGRIVFIGIQTLQGFLPIPLEFTTVVGGYVFGPVQGTLLTVCSVLLSTTAIFFITKRWGNKLLNLFFPPSRQPKWKLLHNPKVRDTFTWVMFLIPGTPKRLFVFSAGLMPQSFGKFLLISTLARVPTILACNFGGHAIGQGDYGQAAVILVVVLLLSLIGALLYRRLQHRKRPK